MANNAFDDMTNKMGGLSPTDAPIPGQSLTEDPDDRSPFERPPEIVDQEEAVRDIFMKLTSEDKVDDVLDVLRMGTPVEDMAQTILFAGFREGKFTPDLMLSLIEPTIYLIMAIADTAGIDYEIYPEEDFWGDGEEEMMMEKDIEGLRSTLGGSKGISSEERSKRLMPKGPEVSLDKMPESVTPSMLEQIKNMDFRGTGIEKGPEAPTEKAGEAPMEAQ